MATTERQLVRLNHRRPPSSPLRPATIAAETTIETPAHLHHLSPAELHEFRSQLASTRPRDARGRFISESEPAATREAREQLTTEEIEELRADIGRYVASHLVFAADGTILPQTLKVDPSKMAAEHVERHHKLTKEELHQLHHDVGVRISHELKRGADGCFLPRESGTAAA